MIEKILQAIAVVIVLMVAFTLLSVILKVASVLLPIVLRLLVILLIGAIVLRFFSLFLRNRS